MQCLRCKKYMHKSIFNDVLIDYCVECNSIWLDQDELEDILENHKPKIEDLIKEAKLEKKSENNSISYEDICPHCGVGKYIKDSKFNLEVDRCSNCNGLFFDKGELKRVIAENNISWWKKVKNYFKSFNFLY